MAHDGFFPSFILVVPEFKKKKKVKGRKGADFATQNQCIRSTRLCFWSDVLISTTRLPALQENIQNSWGIAEYKAMQNKNVVWNDADERYGERHALRALKNISICVDSTLSLWYYSFVQTESTCRKGAATHPLLTGHGHRRKHISHGSQHLVSAALILLQSLHPLRQSKKLLFQLRLSCHQTRQAVVSWHSGSGNYRKNRSRKRRAGCVHVCRSLSTCPLSFSIGRWASSTLCYRWKQISLESALLFKQKK